ncbi:MAG TPA: hypothetical protein VL201_04080 [Patescibacteria group bacterium]|nr:hypothetical protein [Patescibacteria group bacterium]
MALLIVYATILFYNKQLSNKEYWIGFSKYLLLTEFLSTCSFFYFWLHEPFVAHRTAQ